MPNDREKVKPRVAINWFFLQSITVEHFIILKLIME